MVKVRYIIVFLLICSCEGTDEILLTEQPEDLGICETEVISSGKYYEKNGRQFLWAGQDSSTHFDITNWSLNVCYLKNGLGREQFQALINPKYTSLNTEHDYLPDTSRVVVLKSEQGIKAYPFGILRNYELVNENVYGNPVMIVFCFLADFASVYNRNYCGVPLTFAVSGYTYKDPVNYNRLESFMLWDRNSESLWWPINDKSVAGTFQGEDLNKYDRSGWDITTMKTLRTTYPNAKILNNNQTLSSCGTIRKTQGCN